MEDEELLNEAKSALALSYSPYSTFKVGAALATKSGEVYLGTNIENASYGLSMCAERNAIYNAYCHGAEYDDIEAIAIIGDTKEPISPCGACRQVMSELMPKDARVILGNVAGDIKVFTIEELLPYSFTSEDL
jgi:cytidine deaminase